MNRQTILASVHRQLRESLAETGEVRPLGEIVPRVAMEIRVHSKISRAPSANGGPPNVIPIEKVAAFVDGDLEPAEAATICEAVMLDNSVLAEIIAAVRAKQQPTDQLPPLSNSLSTRLLAMRDAIATQNAERETVPDVRLREETLVSSPAARDIPERRSKRLSIVVAVLAIAATVVAAMVVLDRRNEGPRDRELVLENRSDPGAQPEVPDVVPNVEPELPEKDPVPDPRESIVKTRPPSEVVPQPDMNSQPSSEIESAPAVASVTSQSPSVPQDAPAEKMPMPPPDLNPLETRDPIRLARAVPKMTNVKWTEVSGLLAQRNALSADSGSRRGPTWRRIHEGSPSTDQQSSSSETVPAEAVALRTLPFSRAAGELAMGGRVVISGDTGLQINHGDAESSAELNLMYGSLAMVDLAEGTVVKFTQDAETIATLRWQEKASAVVQRFADGLQVLVDGGQIEINSTPVREKSVRVTAQNVETVRAPKRLPRWVTRPDESTAADRLILAQIADTDDLTASLNRRIGALASSPALRRDDARILAKLASWQAAMAGPGLFRLAGNRVPAVRLAAMQRLAQLPESDPRYDHIWNAIDRSVNNPQRTAQMRAWIRLVRAGARPTPAQIEQMISGLSARDAAGRALCDFMLRQYVRNPPPFDPSWTGQRLQRAVNVYRERAGLPMDRARPSAVAPALR